MKIIYTILTILTFSNLRHSSMLKRLMKEINQKDIQQFIRQKDEK